LRVYTLPTSTGEPSLAYTVISYVKSVTETIQLTGHSTVEPIDFSSIVLGDDEMKVRERFGAPYFTEEVEEIEGYKWGYAPFPISIEFIDKKVYSIRISRSAEY